MTDKERPECRCAECATIHSEFISQFGKWPSMSHDEGQRIKRNRRDNLLSWDRIEVIDATPRYGRTT